MTDQPQPLDLDAIEARANNATPGPWQWHVSRRTRDYRLQTVGWDVVMGFARWGRDSAQPEFNIDGVLHDGVDLDQPHPDAEFIAGARQDVDDLLAEVRRLTAERNRYRNAWNNARTRAKDHAADERMWRRIVTSTEQDRDHVLADNDRLRAELQQARKLHAEVPLHLYAEDCPHPEPADDQPDEGAEWDDRHPTAMGSGGYTGDRICLDSPIGRSVCGHCLDADCPEDPAPWPCATATALGLTPAAVSGA